jgi:hypothetical protein
MSSVAITFDCLPLRSVGRLDVPLDASPEFRGLVERIKRAIETHGSHNAYYLYHAKCEFQLTNDPLIGALQFDLEGTVLTDAEDLRVASCNLDVKLARETCDWLTEPVVAWFADTVTRAVHIEFNRYIASGDLAQAKRRAEKIEAACNESGGYLGMYL